MQQHPNQQQMPPGTYNPNAPSGYPTQQGSQGFTGQPYGQPAPPQPQSYQTRPPLPGQQMPMSPVNYGQPGFSQQPQSAALPSMGAPVAQPPTAMPGPYQGAQRASYPSGQYANSPIGMNQPAPGQYQQASHTSGQYLQGGIPPPGAAFPSSAPLDQQRSNSSARINASMVPSPVTVNEADQSRFNAAAYITSSIGVQSPPLPSTMAKYVDDGNSSSRFLRMTTYALPCSEDTLHATRIPLAILMQPFAQRPAYEDPIPLVDFGPEGPIRCNRCRAYMNPFVTFGRGGRVYMCNICFMQNDVRDSYFSNLDMMGRRADIASRPELMHGTIDIVAPADYLLKKPSKASVIFALETSRNAVQSGAFMAYVQMLKEFLAHPDTATRYSRIGIVTFDKNVQFYDLRASLAEPQLMVMSDILEPFVPMNDGLFFDPVGSKEIALSLLDRLPKLFQDSRGVEACFGSATLACYEALKNTGGKVVMLASSLPSVGLGALKPKDLSSTVPPADKVLPALLPQGEFYKELAKKCAAASVCVSIVATPSSSVDLATVNDLAKATSGLCYVYPKFSYDAHLKRLTEETVKALLRFTAYDCVAKIRCGAGLQNDINLGHFTTNEANDLRFACLDSEQTFSTSFVYDSKLQDNDKIGFQLAVLYTTAEGQPRIRIHNLSLACTADVGNVFKLADLDAIVSLQTKQVCSQFQDQPLPFITTQLSSKCAHILAAYRKLCAANMSAGQLVLPDALKLLPLYASCLLKQPLFQNSCSLDSRVSSAHQLVATSFEDLPSLLYPRMFALHHILDADQNRYLPPCLRLSGENIETHGVYLLENSQRLIIWVGQHAQSGILEQLFGVAHLSNINPNLSHLPDLNNEISQKVRLLLQKLQHQRSHYLSLSVIRNGMDPWEHEWNQLLVEEAQPSAPSYVDYLCRIHSQIQQELSATPSLTERAAMLNFLH